jgi:hypothetical protein
MSTETHSARRSGALLVYAGFFFMAFLLAMGWSGLWLAGQGRFLPSTTWWCGLIGGVVGLILARPLARAAPGISLRSVLAGVALLAVALLPNVRQSERILGGWDPGVYLHTASMVARAGAVKIVDPDLPNLTELEREVIARNLFGVVEPFGGMRVLPTGETSPSFHHAYPCLMASVWPLGGLRAALWVNPLFHVGSVVALTVLIGLLFGARWGWVGGLLLAVSPAQIWQAGFSTAEMSTQFFLIAACVFLLLSQTRREGGIGAAVLSSLCLGFALLIRYDTILFLVPLMLMLLAGLHAAPYPRRVLIMIASLLPLVYHFYYIQTYIAPYYHPVSNMVMPVLGTVVGLISGWVVALHVFRRALTPRLPKLDRLLRLGLLGGFSVWFVFVALIRPGLVGRATGDTGPLMAFLAGPDAGNIFHLPAFVGWPVFVFAAVGLLVGIWRVRSLVPRAMLYAAIVSLVIITTHVFNDHFLMWVSRRFIPVIIPLLVVMAVASLATIHQRWPVFRSWRGAVVLVMLVLSVVPGSYAVMRHRDWPGLMAWYDQLVPSIPAEATVFCDQPGFAAPLRYLYGRHTYELQRRSDDARDKLAEVMRSRMELGESVYLLSMRGPIDHPAVVMTPVAEFPLRSHILQDQTRGIPRTTKSRGGDFVLYQVGPGD